MNDHFELLTLFQLRKEVAGYPQHHKLLAYIDKKIVLMETELLDATVIDKSPEPEPELPNLDRRV